MPSMMFGAINDNPVPVDEVIVRRTATPVSDDTPAAMAPDAPDPNEVETDPNPSLGMVNRTLASHWVPSEKSTPSWLDRVNTQTEHNAVVDRQVSTSGHAANLESQGVWGHGTMPYAEGIEPVGDLRDGGRMGNEYFAANDPEIQLGAGDYMSIPPGQDHEVIANNAALSKEAARKAALASMYNAAFGGMAHG